MDYHFSHNSFEKHNSQELLQFFEFSHLPPHLQPISQLFHGVAHDLVSSLPNNAEKTTALRKLLEAKDCAVRAQIAKEG